MYKKWLLYWLIIFQAISLSSFAQNDLPKPEGWVNDFAGVISPEYKEKINSLITEVEAKTKNEIAVVTVDSIAPYDEKEYARMLFDNWKPGKKGKDNGVLILLAVKERRWRIETGYGIEGILPDGVCGEIGRNYMVAYFKQEKYGEWLYNGVLKIGQIITGEAIEPTTNIPDVNWPQIIIAVFLAFILPWRVIFLITSLAMITLAVSSKPGSSILVLSAFCGMTIIIRMVFYICIFKKGIPGKHYRHTPDGGFNSGGFGGGFEGGGGFGGGSGGGGGAGGGF